MAYSLSELIKQEQQKTTVPKVAVRTPESYQKLAANQPAYTGGPERALVNQQSLNATDAEYKAILDQVKQGAEARRAAVAAAEDITKTEEERAAGAKAAMQQAAPYIQREQELINQQVAKLPAVTTPYRSTSLEVPGPTPQKPLVPVSAEGVNIYTGMPESGSQMLAPETDYSAQPYGADKLQMASDFYQPFYEDLRQRMDEAAAARDEAFEKAKTEADEDKKRELERIGNYYDQQEQEIKQAGAEAVKQAGMNLAFSGFGRSTRAAEIKANIGSATQAQLAQLAYQESADIRQIEDAIDSQIDTQMKAYDEKLESLGEEEKALRKEELALKGDLMKEIIKNDPNDPMNQLEIMSKMTDINYKNFQIDKSIKDQAQSEAQNIIENAVKYGYVPSAMTSEQMQNVAYNLGIPASKVADVINDAVNKAAEEKTKYQISSDGMGGMYVFDPIKGQVIGKYDAFGNYTSEDGSSPPFVPNTSNTTINATNVAKSILGATITQGYGVVARYETNGKHGGLDYVLPGGKNALVQVPVGGTVVAVSTTGDYGNSVTVQDADGRKHKFSHLSAINVKQGQQLTAGDAVGKQGNTGHVIASPNGDGTHVDYRVYENGVTINPADFLASLKSQPAISGPSSQVSTSGPITSQAAMQEAANRGYAGKDAIAFAQTAVQTGTYPSEMTMADKIDQSNKLATRFKPLMDEYRELDQGMAVAKTFNVNTTNPYDDQALIFSFMKVLDPASVVREGEFKTAQNNTSILNSLAANWNQAVAGQGMLTPDQRQNVLNTMNTLYNQKSGMYAGQLAEAERIGTQSGIDPSLYLTYQSQDIAGAANAISQPLYSGGAGGQTTIEPVTDDFMTGLFSTYLTDYQEEPVQGPVQEASSYLQKYGIQY